MESPRKKRGRYSSILESEVKEHGKRLSQRMHPFHLFPIGLFPEGKLKKYQEITSPQSKLEYHHSPSSSFSKEIPPLNYSSFKHREKYEARRKSITVPPIFEQLLAKFNIKIAPETKDFNRQPTIKESIANKRAYKRIELQEIGSPNKSLGQKLLMVDELVINPLLADGELN